MVATENFEKIEISSQSDLRDWLTAHHRQTDSVWLVTFKKHVLNKYVSTDQILDELLCFGWIDGVRRKLDDDRTMQLISPRKMQAWAKTYQERAAHLIAAGVMHQSGLAAVDHAKKAGSWDAAAQVDALVVPDDLAKALAIHPVALTYYQACPPSYQRNVLRHLFSAKTDVTRQKRIALIVDTCVRRERIPQL